MAGKRTRARHAPSTRLVSLKVICRDIDVDTRQARMALRALSKAGKLKHSPHRRWEWPATQVDDIRRRLTTMNGERFHDDAKKATPRSNAASLGTSIDNTQR